MRTELHSETGSDMTPAALRTLLASAGLSQVRAAQELGISDRTMRRYIAGDLPIPRYIVLALRWLEGRG